MNFKNIAKSVLQRSANCAIDEIAKNCCKSHKCNCNPMSKAVKFGKDSYNSICNFPGNISGYLAGKYSEARKSKKQLEEERKKEQRRALRNNLIVGIASFTAGAATGYLLVKKAQIKQSDYIFTDNEVVKNPSIESNPINNQLTNQDNTNIKKEYTNFNGSYQISTDGTTLIRNNRKK